MDGEIGIAAAATETAAIVRNRLNKRRASFEDISILLKTLRMESSHLHQDHRQSQLQLPAFNRHRIDHSHTDCFRRPEWTRVVLAPSPLLNVKTGNMSLRLLVPPPSSETSLDIFLMSPCKLKSPRLPDGSPSVGVCKRRLSIS